MLDVRSLTIGSTKAVVEEQYGVVDVIADSTIGIELFIDGAITNLWAGMSCIFG